MAADSRTRDSLDLLDHNNGDPFSHDLACVRLLPGNRYHDLFDVHGPFMYQCTCAVSRLYASNMVVQYMLSDTLVVWRAWVMWPDNKFVKGLLVSCMICGTSECSLIACLRPAFVDGGRLLNSGDHL